VKLTFNNYSFRNVGELNIKPALLMKFLLGGEYWFDELYFAKPPNWVFERVKFDKVSVTKN
jgi:hypothetical protein